MSRIIKMQIVHKKRTDRAEAIADDLMKQFNQQEDEEGDYSKILLDSIKIAERQKRSARLGLDTPTVGLFKK